MNNDNLNKYTIDELAKRLATAEAERANFRAQAILLYQENENLKKQIEDLQKDSDKSKEKQPETSVDKEKQDPQANK